MKPDRYCRLDTPIGTLTVAGHGEGITHVLFQGEEAPRDLRNLREEKSGAPERACRQLEEYFAGARRVFDVPLDPSGTPFMREAWDRLAAIPWGETRSYGQVAADMGRPKAARAVGLANNRNPIPIFIPCHRVVGSTGKLTGYRGGLRAKELLLELEQA